MNRARLQAELHELDRLGYYVFSTSMLKQRFVREGLGSFKASLHRHVTSGLLEHPCRGIYLNPYARCRDEFTLERIALALRPGHYNYLSLESRLSELGLISQIPLNGITIMTTGRSQRYKTPYGQIEFIHTKRTIRDILEHTTHLKTRPLRMASSDMAIRDLNNVKRNTQLINTEALDHE